MQYTVPTLKRLRDHCRKDRKTIEPGGMEKVSSWNSRETTHVNSQWLRGHAQALWNPTADQIPAWRGDLCTMNFLAIVGCGERKSQFSLRVYPLVSSMFQWKATYPRIFGQHKWTLMGKKRMQSWWEEKGKSWGREGIYDQNSLYEILKKTNKTFLKLWRGHEGRTIWGF